MLASAETSPVSYDGSVLTNCSRKQQQVPRVLQSLTLSDDTFAAAIRYCSAIRHCFYYCSTAAASIAAPPRRGSGGRCGAGEPSPTAPKEPATFVSTVVGSRGCAASQAGNAGNFRTKLDAGARSQR